MPGRSNPNGCRPRDHGSAFLHDHGLCLDEARGVRDEAERHGWRVRLAVDGEGEGCPAETIHGSHGNDQQMVIET